MTKLAYTNHARPGSPPPQRAVWLAAMCRKHGYKHGAELGTKEGMVPAYLFGAGAVDSMVVVDLWEGVSDNQTETYRAWPWSSIRAQYAVNRAPFADHWATLEMSTVQAASQVSDGSLDFVFIDADHSKSGVLADLRAWVHKVRGGGMVAGHDYGWPSVRAALTEYGAAVKRAPDGVWYWIQANKEASQCKANNGQCGSSAWHSCFPSQSDLKP